MNRKLIKYEEYKQLNPCVDRANLPWHLDGSPMNEIIDI